MIEPVALADLFLSFFTGAMIIVAAALYAAFFAWHKIGGIRSVGFAAIAVYLLLLACVVVFSEVMNLTGHWRAVAILMALGYWWMPRLIWRLCLATHADGPRH